MKITAELLIEHGAEKNCHDLILFRKLWRRGGEVTLKRCLQAAKAGLDITWAADRLLSTPALAGYRDAKAPASAAFQDAKAVALAAYQDAKAPAPALAAFQNAIAVASAGYRDAIAVASAGYRDAMAVAFYEACRSAATAAGGNDGRD